MEFSKIHPFARYVHYLPLDKNSVYSETVPYDNRMFFTLKGNGRILVEDVSYNMQKGSVLIIPSGVRYKLLAPLFDVTYIAINFDYTSDHTDKKTPIPPVAVPLYEPQMRIEQVYFSDISDFNHVVHIENMFGLSHSLLKIHSEFTRRLIYSDSIISNLMSEVLLHCARKAYTQHYNASSDTVSLVIDYINENYGKSITNKTIGEKFNLHPNYVSNIVKVFTGMPLHQYVMHTRISVSVELLSEQTLSISEISERCGFSSIYHFSKAFKKIIGVSPSKYQ